MLPGVVLVVFTAFSLIADRVMPVIGDTGLVIVLCTGDGPVQLRVDPDTREPVEDAPYADAPCDWAAAKPGSALIALGAAILPASAIAMAGAMPQTTALCHSRASGLPPATGPPSPI